MAANLRDPGSILNGDPKKFKDSSNYVFYIVGECFSSAAGTHVATDLTCKVMKCLQNQIRVTLLCHGVTKILTLHKMSKMDFEPDFRNPQMLSYLNMCNTMGSKMDGLAVREHFFSKIAEKTAFWAATFSDHLTSEI